MPHGWTFAKHCVGSDLEPDSSSFLDVVFAYFGVLGDENGSCATQVIVDYVRCERVDLVSTGLYLCKQCIVVSESDP